MNLNLDEIRKRATGDLCRSDPRSPSFFKSDQPIVARSDCYCDNCFHYKDRAAVATLALCDEVDRLKAENTLLHAANSVLAKVARRALSEFPLTDGGYCTYCRDPFDHTKTCFRVMAERALANGGAGGGE